MDRASWRSETPPPAPKLCEWIEPGLREIAGQDPLGLQTITTDRILPALLPGVLALSRRARYLSIYSFLLRRYERSAGQADNTALDAFIRSREFELSVAANLCSNPDCNASGAIGNLVARPLVASAPSSYETDRASSGSEPGADPEPGLSPEPGLGPEPSARTRFFGSKRLQADRYASDFKKLADEILGPLGATPGVTLSVTVEIEATTPDGFDDAKVRTVSENAATLRFEQGGFEQA